MPGPARSSTLRSHRDAASIMTAHITPARPGGRNRGTSLRSALPPMISHLNPPSFHAAKANKENVGEQVLPLEPDTGGRTETYALDAEGARIDLPVLSFGPSPSATGSSTTDGSCGPPSMTAARTHLVYRPNLCRRRQNYPAGECGGEGPRYQRQPYSASRDRHPRGRRCSRTLLLSVTPERWATQGRALQRFPPNELPGRGARPDRRERLRPRGHTAVWTGVRREHPHPRRPPCKRL